MNEFSQHFKRIFEPFFGRKDFQNKLIFIGASRIMTFSNMSPFKMTKLPPKPEYRDCFKQN